MSNEPEPMGQQYADTLELYLKGHSPSEIAKTLGVTHKCVWERLRRPEVQAKLAQIQDEHFKAAAGRLKRLTDRAVCRVADIMEREESTDPDIIRAAFGILDRAGLGPTQKHEVEHETTMELVVNGERLAMPDKAPPPPQLPGPDED